MNNRLLKKVSILLAFSCIALLTNAQVKIWEEKLSLPTYLPKPADKNPMFYVPDAYQGAKRVIYPYAMNNNLSTDPIDKEYTAVYIENEYIKLCILPEIGGRLFYVTDKTNDYEIFYRQHVIKPANVGMFGAWISGGVEWCVFHHHRASTYLPVDYKLVENEDGSKTVWFGEIEPRHRMKWSIGLTLYPGKSYMEADVRMYNRTENTNSILYWANVATHVNDDYQVIFPESVNQGVYHAKNSFIHWPIANEVYNGKDYTGNIDVSWWKNHPEPVSIFAHNLQEDFMGGYDYDKNAGTVHVGNHHIVKGAKLWEWGPGDYGKMWDCKILTDNDGPYAELMVGAYSDNQPDYSWIMPYEVKSFKHYWYPARDINGFKTANLNAAINVTKDKIQLEIGINATNPISNAVLRVQKQGEIIFEEKCSLSPDKPFNKTIKVSKNTMLKDYKTILFSSTGEELISYKESIPEYEEALPNVVEPPLKPADIANIEELVLTGQRIMQFHNPRYFPEDYFNEALRRDSLNVQANLLMGNLCAKSGKYDEAANHYRQCINRLTKNYTRPRDCEAFYRLGVILKKQNKLHDAIDTLYRATWDYAYYAAAHFELASVSALQGNYDNALNHLNLSLKTNGVNTNALGMKATILRNADLPGEAKEVAQSALYIDPLDHHATYELFKMQDIEASAFTKLLNDNKENYLELASDFMHFGFFKDALDVLQIAEKSKNRKLAEYPIIRYYLGYVYAILGNETLAKEYYTNGSILPTDYCFPFRFETLDVLNKANSFNPGDAKASYYAGNILYDHQPGKAMDYWKRAVEINPSLAIACRNLGWGAYRYQNDIPQAITYYEQAILKNNQEPRYFYELDILYEKNNTDIEKRSALMASNHKTVKLRDDALLREINLMVLTASFDEALEELDSKIFPRQEGEAKIHDIYVDANLLKGRSLLEANKADEALNYFLAANQYPEKHQIGRMLGYEKEAQIFYYTGLGFKKLGRDAEAEKYFNLAISTKTGSGAYLYYRGISMKEIGEIDHAKKAFSELLQMGREDLKNAEDEDFFAKFGEAGGVEDRKAEACFKIALAYKGMRDIELANEFFSQSLKHRNSNVWARVYANE